MIFINNANGFFDDEHLEWEGQPILMDSFKHDRLDLYECIVTSEKDHGRKLLQGWICPVDNLYVNFEFWEGHPGYLQLRQLIRTQQEQSIIDFITSYFLQTITLENLQLAMNDSFRAGFNSCKSKIEEAINSW